MTAKHDPRGVRLRIACTVVTLLCGVVSVSVMAQAPPPLKLVSTAWPPFTNEIGRARFALDLVEAALNRIGRTATTTIVRPAQFTTALLGSSFDGSAAVWKDPERERTLVFSQPYLENRLVLVGRQRADVSATSMSDLKGKRVAVVDGYSYGDAIENSGALFVRSNTEEDSLALLLKGTVDYTLMDDLVVQHIVSIYPKESAARLRIGSTPLVKRELYLAIRRSRPDAESIVASFNAQLRGLIADRTYHRLLHVDWIMADIDGDGAPEYVPADDRPGPTEPLRIYTLFTPPQSSTIQTTLPRAGSKPDTSAPGFYLGGNIYSNWASVPENYKVSGGGPRPDAARSTASIFNFKW